MGSNRRRYVAGVTFGDLDTLSNPEPAWVQLYAVLKAAIEDGTYPPRTPMPSVRQIREESGLARGTIAKAFDRLRDEGLIIMIPGRGAFVSRRLCQAAGRYRVRAAKIPAPEPGSRGDLMQVTQVHVSRTANLLSGTALDGHDPLVSSS